jgi:hypothetical protein
VGDVMFVTCLPRGLVSQVGTMLQYMEASKVDHSGHHTHTAHHVSPVVARGRLPTDII